MEKMKENPLLKVQLKYIENQKKITTHDFVSGNNVQG